MSRLTKGTEFKLETKSGLIIINDKPVSISCKLMTKNDGYYQFNMSSPKNNFEGNASKYRNFLKLGSSLQIFDINEKELIISFDRKDRGKVNVVNNVTKQNSIISIKQLMEYYPVLLEIVFGDAPLNQVKKNVEKTEVKVAASSALLEKELETVNDKVFILKDNFKNGKDSISQINISIENSKPFIEICHTAKGFSKATRLTFSYKKGNRTKYERTTIDSFNPSIWMKMFNELVNGNINIVEASYWGRPFKYTMNLFTLEYVQNKFLFSYTLNKGNSNHETIYFAEINEDELVKKENYAIEVIASLFGKTEEEFPEYMKSILFSLNKKSNENQPEVLKPYYQWAKEKGFSLDYLPSYDTNQVAKVLSVVKKGFDHLDAVIDYSKYKPLYSLAVQNTQSYYGFYFHKSSKLAFSLKLFNESTISTVYHEYGHLIYYSLMNKQIMTEEVATKNEGFLNDFLSNYKNCSYIEYFKEKRMTSKLSYYREDTELFARLFETFMLMKTNQYDEVSQKKKALNSRKECEEFILFMNKNFDINLSL